MSTRCCSGSGTTVQEIDHFIAELQALRQRLQHEVTRVERAGLSTLNEGQQIASPASTSDLPTIISPVQ
jgi:hypothetical protein